MENAVSRLWRTPLVLLALSAVPLLATANRLISFVHPTAAKDPGIARFEGASEALILHILAVSVFLLLAVAQFSSALRRAYPLWHRRAGTVAMITGIAAGVSGVWLVAAFPPSALATPVMDVIRVLFGLGLACCIVCAAQAIRNGDVAAHRAWMIRAVALGVAGSTQALAIGVWIAAYGALTPESATILLAAGFFFNIAVAEWWLRARSRPARGFAVQRPPF